MKENIIIFSWSSYLWRTEGARSLPSCFDTYDREYGWTADDYRRASGGVDTRYDTLGISRFSLDKNIILSDSIRFKNKDFDQIPNKYDEKNWANFYSKNDLLIDFGHYGIFDSLNNVMLFDRPNFDDIIKKIC